MPSMYGSLCDAVAAGYTNEKCAHCGGWTWWHPANRPENNPRIFCSQRACEAAERTMREAEAAKAVSR